MTEQYYPPAGFYFTVTVLGPGMALAALTEVDASFREVSGIQAEFGVEEVVEGGENRFVHRLPKPAKYPNLVLKRGVVTQDSFLAEWVGQTVGSGLSLPIVPQILMVTLLNSEGMPSILWGFANAYPVKWDVGPLDSLKNEILTETMEFSYNYIERIVLGSGASLAAKVTQLATRLV